MLQKNFAVRRRKKNFFLVFVQKDEFFELFKSDLGQKIFFFISYVYYPNTNDLREKKNFFDEN